MLTPILWYHVYPPISIFLSKVFLPVKFKQARLLSEGTTSATYEVVPLSQNIFNAKIMYQTHTQHYIFQSMVGDRSKDQMIKINTDGDIIDSMVIPNPIMIGNSYIIAGKETYYDWIITGNKKPIPYKSIWNADESMDYKTCSDKYAELRAQTEYADFDSFDWPTKCYFYINAEWHLLHLHPDIHLNLIKRDRDTTDVLLDKISVVDLEPANKTTHSIQLKHFVKESIEWHGSYFFPSIPIGYTWAGEGYYVLNYKHEQAYFKMCSNCSSFGSYGHNRKMQFYAPIKADHEVTFLKVEAHYSSNLSANDGLDWYIIRKKRP